MHHSLHELSTFTDKTHAVIPVQVTKVTPRETKALKPFFMATISDATHSATVNIWGDTGAFAELDSNRNGGFYFLDAGFVKDSYGLSVDAPILRVMNPQEKDEFLAGGGEAKEIADREWEEITSTVDAFTIEPLKIVLQLILKKVEPEFRRAAAALKNHHNRRGGLLSHTSSMLRVAKSLAPHYGDVCPDLLYSGVILHDVGKVVENDTRDGFAAEVSEAGEALGHISIGTGMVDIFWQEATAANPELFKNSKTIRVHLKHLILAHHGQKDFGSPVTPKTPEAFLLHHIDLMDAKMEMVRSAYANGTPSDKGLYDAGYPLKTTLLTPLARRLKQ